MSGINGVLAGLLLAMTACWALYAFNRLWQQSLEEEAGEALGAAVALGLTREPAPLGPLQVASGRLGDREVRVEWRGGVWGGHTVVQIGQERRTLPLIRDAEGLSAALGITPAA